jgi:hypothetical protein
MQPGMPAEIVIKTGERSMLTYLLHPLVKRIGFIDEGGVMRKKSLFLQASTFKSHGGNGHDDICHDRERSVFCA